MHVAAMGHIQWCRQHICQYLYVSDVLRGHVSLMMHVIAQIVIINIRAAILAPD